MPRSLRGAAEVLAAGFLPGALAGTHLAGLIFFLNPGLPFTPGPVLRGIAFYGALLGAAGLALHLPFTWGKPWRARRVLPWGLTVALAASALLDGAHASYYAYFLLPGINERLIKTALWLALAAIIAFYTALLHSLQHRRYGMRSRLALALLAALSIYVMVERREAFRPRLEPSPRPPAAEAGERPRLWVVGLDGATLDAILPLAGQGRLPFFATLLRQGAYGRLATLSPHRRAALWATLATGKYPYKHGVTGGLSFRADFLAPRGELRLLPVGMSFRRWGTLGAPAERPARSRRAAALWEILSRLGVRGGLIGWPDSAPLPRRAAFAFAERFFSGGARPGDVRPRAIAGRAAMLRVPPEEIGVAELAGFGPSPPEPLVRSLAGDLWRESVGLALGEEDPQAEALFLVLPGLAQVSRRWFGGYSAVQFEGDTSPRARRSEQRVSAYYEHLDRFLARIGGGRDLLVVVSAHGTDAAVKWRKLSGGERAVGGHFSGSPDGVLILFGPGVRPGALLTGARLVDVAPTLLYGLGFPVARDFDGQVLTSAFDPAFLARHPLTFLPSYEALAGGGSGAQ